MVSASPCVVVGRQLGGVLGRRLVQPAFLARLAARAVVRAVYDHATGAAPRSRPSRLCHGGMTYPAKPLVVERADSVGRVERRHNPPDQ